METLIFFNKIIMNLYIFMVEIRCLFISFTPSSKMQWLYIWWLGVYKVLEGTWVLLRSYKKSYFLLVKKKSIYTVSGLGWDLTLHATQTEDLMRLNISAIRGLILRKVHWAKAMTNTWRSNYSLINKRLFAP